MSYSHYATYSIELHISELLIVKMRTRSLLFLGLWISNETLLFYSQWFHVTTFCSMRFDLYPLDRQVRTDGFCSVLFLTICIAKVHSYNLTSKSNSFYRNASLKLEVIHTIQHL